MNSKDYNRGKWEARKRKERELQRQKDIRERELVKGYRGNYG